MIDRLLQEQAAFEAALSAVDDEDGLYRLQVAFLGKKGSITGLSKQMGRSLLPSVRASARS